MARTKAGSKSARKFLYVFGIVVVIAVIVLIANQLATNADHTRFKNAEKTKSTVSDKLVDYLGNKVTSVKEHDECFNTEQGPYDHGNLWCQSATVMSLGRNVNYSKMGDIYLQIGRSLHLQTSSHVSNIFPSYTLKLNSGIDCQLESLDSSGRRDGAAMSIPFNENDHIALAITCADRARAAYYPLVD